MAPDRGEPDDRPSLEMPSFSLRRKKEQAVEPDSEPAAEQVPAEAPTVVETAEQTIDASPVAPAEPRPRRELPALSGPVAAVAAGLAVGVLAVLLTWLAGVACDAGRGTSSCGGAIGFPVLVVVLALLAWTGTVLLRALGVADAGSTSLLAVGVLAVLVMFFLLGSLDEWWTAVAVPVLAAASYTGSWALTNAVADPGPDGPEPGSYDVR
ncbi:hypothetical protein EUA93_05410 [Nocardioides oleivorans]|uniref:Uncharacterized protein n=1 Tax=Nocardioides oleivorans TaxID=273676 RepID=A0A4Q2S0G3_9ACTN|nr:hypothetical protein [Nocardioides oleivorans]RYB93845.1 hypothetical protein EUA93_05410 [Nocardioides oleivorans]